MANWWNTEVVVECSEESLNFYKEKLSECSLDEEGNYDLNEFLAKIGLDPNKHSDEYKFTLSFLKGAEFDFEKGLFSFGIRSAWMFDLERIFKKVFLDKGDKCYVFAYEPINNFNGTNDLEQKYFEYPKYWIGYSNGKEMCHPEENEFYTEEEVVDFLKEKFPNEKLETFEDVVHLTERLDRIYEENKNNGLDTGNLNFIIIDKILTMSILKL